MFIIFIFFWLIALFVFLKENRRASDTWIAISLFLFGCGGLSAFAYSIGNATEVGEVIPWGWMFSGSAASLSLLWGPYALLIFSLHYAGLMPKTSGKRMAVYTVLALPVGLFYILVPALAFFGQQLPIETRVEQTKILALIFAPYYWGVVGILYWKLRKKEVAKQNVEDIITFIIVAPSAISYYFLSYFIPSFGNQNIWPATILSIAFVLLAFVFFFIKKNIFGLSFYRATIKAEIGERTIECIDSVKQSIKGNLIQIQNALNKVEVGANDLQQQDEVDPIIQDVNDALTACTDSLAMLNDIRMRMNPKLGELTDCALSNLLERSIQRGLAIDSERNIVVKIDCPIDHIITCDADLLEKALTEIIINAIEAAKPEHALLLVVEILQNRREIMIRIRDNAGGVAPRLVSSLGIPMFTTKKDGHHMGLGLYYVKKIIDLHNGRFLLASHDGDRCQISMILPKKPTGIKRAVKAL